MIDLDLSEMRFARNGKDLGTAFVDFDTNLEWFPALSMAGEQQVQVRFGHCPYRPLSTLSLGFKSLFQETLADVSQEISQDPFKEISQQMDIPSSSLNAFFTFEIIVWNLDLNLFPQIGIMDLVQGKLIRLILFQNPENPSTLSCSFQQSILLQDVTFESFLSNEKMDVKDLLKDSIKTLDGILLKNVYTIRIEIPFIEQQEKHILFYIHGQSTSLPWNGRMTESILPFVKNMGEYEMTWKHPSISHEQDPIKC